jgi:DNA mismatch repair ATPase MutS
MSAIADLIRPRSLLLCNESFASTNEREGSEIARQLIKAMLEGGVKVAYVTHLYDLADSLHREQLPEALFFRAERKPDGRRTYRVVPGEPLPTSHGEDSYRRIFGADADERPAGERVPAAGGLD